jgi:hypothetical protein
LNVADTITPRLPNAEQPRQVVPGDVLDDDAATFRETAVRARDGDANDEIARPAVAVPAGSAVAGRDQAANGGIVPAGRVEREPLTVPRERAVDVAQRRAGLDRGREIAMAVLDHRVQARGRQEHVEPVRRRAPAEPGAAPANHHREFLASGPCERPRDAVGVGRLDGDLRLQAFDDVVGRGRADGIRAERVACVFQESRPQHLR